MKQRKFTREEKFFHHLLLHSHDVPMAIGLLDGMAGIMLVLAHYSRVKKRPSVEKSADFLMSQITESMLKTASPYFGSGLAGIGWSIEYLIQNGYMGGCGVDLTGEMDERIMSFDIRHISDDSLDSGILGLYHYVVAHVQGAAMQGRRAFDTLYLDDWQNVLSARREKFPNDPKWGNMLAMLTGTMEGKSPYKLDLVQFIKPMKSPSLNYLGLQRGLAGYIEMGLKV